MRLSFLVRPSVGFLWKSRLLRPARIRQKQADRNDKKASRRWLRDARILEIFACYTMGPWLRPIDTGEFSRHGYCGSAKNDSFQVSTGRARVKILWQSIMNPRCSTDRRLSVLKRGR